MPKMRGTVPSPYYAPELSFLETSSNRILQERRSIHIGWSANLQLPLL